MALYSRSMSTIMYIQWVEIKLEICLTHLFSAKFHGINLAILLLLNLFFCYYSVCEETDTYADWYCKIET